MKRFLYYLALVPGLLVASPDCMTTSYHGYRCSDNGNTCAEKQWDNKQLRYVNGCTCNCRAYQQLSQKGECPNCLHSHAPYTLQTSSCAVQQYSATKKAFIDGLCTTGLMHHCPVAADATPKKATPRPGSARAQKFLRQ